MSSVVYEYLIPYRTYAGKNKTLNQRTKHLDKQICLCPVSCPLHCKQQRNADKNWVKPTMKPLTGGGADVSLNGMDAPVCTSTCMIFIIVNTPPSGQTNVTRDVCPTVVWKVASSSSGRVFLDCDDTNHLFETMAAELLGLNQVTRLMYAARYRKGGLFCRRTASQDRGRTTYGRTCQQRSRFISSALVSGSRSLSGVSDCERHMADVQGRLSNLFIFATCQSLKQLPGGLT